MVNVAYFSNQFADRHGHGLSRYARQLHQGLTQYCSDINACPVAAWTSMADADLRVLQEKTDLQLLSLGRQLTPLGWTFFNNPKIERLLDARVDVVHAVALGYPVATDKPLVVTIHDLGPLTHRHFFSNTRPWVMKRSLAQATAQAAAIICVSHSTAREVQSYVDMPLEDRLLVIHEGVGEEFFAPHAATSLDGVHDCFKQGVPYILATGKMSPRKNLTRVIRALKHLEDKIPHHLVLVGANGWDMRQIHKELEHSTVKGRVHFPGYVTDEQLRAIYSGASAYIHPSLYEGFGLTVLEAMAMGCPVVTSNVYSLPEVAGDAACLVNPLDIDEIAASMLKVCLDDAYRTALVEKGRLRARSFSWRKCSERMAEVYRTVANDGCRRQELI